MEVIQNSEIRTDVGLNGIFIRNNGVKERMIRFEGAHYIAHNEDIKLRAIAAYMSDNPEKAKHDLFTEMYNDIKRKQTNIMVPVMIKRRNFVDIMKEAGINDEYQDLYRIFHALYHCFEFYGNDLDMIRDNLFERPHVSDVFFILIKGKDNNNLLLISVYKFK